MRCSDTTSRQSPKKCKVTKSGCFVIDVNFLIPRLAKGVAIRDERIMVWSSVSVGGDGLYLCRIDAVSRVAVDKVRRVGNMQTEVGILPEDCPVTD
jgi:hypothetical protein